MGPNGANKKLPSDLVDQMHTMFGPHPGYRVTHAKGILLDGTFTPTAEAKTICKAPHFNNPSTKLKGRFSVGGGIPNIPDANGLATPKGLALRFQIDKDTETDLISHSYYGFAASNGEDFLEFLRVFTNSKTDPDSFQKFLSTHPPALAFVQTPKPNPVSYGTLPYYQVNTHVLTNAEGKKTNVRYRLVPDAGEHKLSDEDAAKQAPDYLMDDLKARLPGNPITFQLMAHLANPDDVLDDATVPYKSTTLVHMGTVKIEAISANNAAKQQQIAFSPIPEGVPGVAPSKDPLINTRHGVYGISTEERRAAPPTQ